MDLNEKLRLKALEDHAENVGSDGVCQKTLNGYGFSLNMIDEMQQKFLEFAKTATEPVADLGVGFGYSSRILLDETKTKIIANDLCKEHLDFLYRSVTDTFQKSRLTIKPGNALELDFEDGSLDGIQAIRWFYFLRPNEIRLAFQLFFKWLSPGGKVFINAFSPYFKKLFGPFLPIYHEQRAKNEEWPGLMEAENVCWLKSGVAQDFGYVCDAEVFRREAVFGGFTVEICEYYQHPEERSRDEGKELLGMIAVKPFI